VKCPKCDYLGFDTGNRCKNCGYDFSLVPNSPDAGTPQTTPQLLSLFPSEQDDDEPLIKLPAAPRPPLSVRKTPESPRLRSMPRQPRHVEHEPVLVFADESAPDLDLPLHEPAPAAPEPVRVRPATHRAPAAMTLEAGPSPPWARLAAAAIDHLILFGVDAIVVYFTLRMAALTPADWHMLPPAPLMTFLILLKLAYFVAFTAVGGQTIGKMALSIRVVSDDGPLDAACAVRRALLGLVSSVVLGLGFAPALVSADRRALHDRFAHTRVVTLRSA
jgi:uncharacterized RDD family membrane protein YckC